MNDNIFKPYSFILETSGHTVLLHLYLCSVLHMHKNQSQDRGIRQNHKEKKNSSAVQEPVFTLTLFHWMYGGVITW